jgi:hypothetical protein
VEFVWDERKNRANQRKHRVSFETASHLLGVIPKARFLQRAEGSPASTGRSLPPLADDNGIFMRNAIKNEQAKRRSGGLLTPRKKRNWRLWPLYPTIRSTRRISPSFRPARGKTRCEAGSIVP